MSSKHDKTQGHVDYLIEYVEKVLRADQFRIINREKPLIESVTIRRIPMEYDEDGYPATDGWSAEFTEGGACCDEIRFPNDK